MTILEEQYNHYVKVAKNPVISLTNVGKTYTVHHEKPTLAENIAQFLRRQKDEKYTALKDVNLRVYAGEKVGFYGPNGVGKSTLLKLIAGISNPSSGTIKTKGRIVSLIDLAAGFHPDLTGEENILLNGLIVGMSKKEIAAKKQAIIDFADIGDFINVPLYTYSSGMQLRLGFSIAIHADPDILLLDEVVTAGDENFRKKTEAAMNEMFNNEKTVLIVNHWLEFLEKNCTRLIYLKKD